MGVKGVIVAAGYGTRFLPITRSVPKEMLPLLDRPAIDFAAAELQEAGIEDVLVITSRRKKAIEDWFDRDPELEAALPADKRPLISPRPLRITTVRQAKMAGTGDALRLARSFAGSDPVVVVYPDDLFGAPNLSTQLIEAWQQTGCSVLSAVDCAGEDVSRYGVLDVTDDLRVRRFVEKPAPGTEPSSLASMGRYLYTPEFFQVLEETHRAHTGGEFYHVPAVNQLAAEGKVVAVVAKAERRDIGELSGYAIAFVEEALARPGVGDELRAWLKGRV